MPRTVKRLVPYFGSDALVAPEIGKLLKGRKHVVVPFCGGCKQTNADAPEVLIVRN